MECGKIAMMHGRGLVSSLIRWQTFSRWSHCALVYPNGEWIIEAWPGKGVQKKKITDWNKVELFFIKGITEEQWKIAFNWAESQLGKGYDYWGVLHFIPRIHLPDNKKFFCSEFVFDALKVAGINLQERINAQELSPREIGISPLLIS